MLTKEQYYDFDEAFERLTKAMKNETKIRREQNLLLDRNFKTMYPVIVRWMNHTNAKIIKALNQKYINKSFQKTEVGRIVANLTDWGELKKDGIRMVKPTTMEIFETGGNEAFKIAGIEGAFDIVNVEAVNKVNEICSTLIVEVNGNTKKAINTLIKTGIQEGQSMGKVAKQIRPLVGLTERQSLAVVHYREKLLKKYPKYTTAKLDKMSKRYSDKLHRYRADMIARTETARAQNEGTLQGYKQLGYKRVEWSANADACDRCNDLNGHRFNLEEASGMMPDHPSCRCAWISVMDGVRPKAPKVPSFTPAKTIGEAEEYAINKGATLSNYKGFSLEKTNKINKALNDVPKDAIPDYIGNSSTYKNVTSRSIPRKNKEFYGMSLNVEGTYPKEVMDRIGIEKYKGIKTLGGNFKTVEPVQNVFFSNGYKSFNEITIRKKSINAYYKKEHGFDWFFNATGETVPYHEFGHIYYNKMSPKGWEEIAKKWYNETKYGSISTKSEAFAEAFADYTLNNGKRLPTYVKKYLDEVIK